MSVLLGRTDDCMLGLEDQSCLFSCCNGGVMCSVLGKLGDNKSLKWEKLSFIDGQWLNKCARLWLSNTGGD